MTHLPVSRDLLQRLQEKLNCHRDAVEWGELCALLANPDHSVDGNKMVGAKGRAD